MRRVDREALPKIDPEADENLLRELTPTIGELLDKHLVKSNENVWFPHEHIPYDVGRSYYKEAEDKDKETEPRELWTPDHLLPPEVESALFVGLLTEDNLPYYFETIERKMGGNEPLRVWNRRWTAEEGRHAYTMREFLHSARIINPWLLEEGRMEQMSGGEVPNPPSITDGFVYVSWQEPATRESHDRTGIILDAALKEIPEMANGEAMAGEDLRRRAIVGKAGMDILKLVAGDENQHFAFYSRVVRAALEIDPSTVVGAIERQIRSFAMPGTGIPNFPEHARRIADAGIYDLRIHHDKILVPVVKNFWKVDQLDAGLTDEAKRAQEAIMAEIDRIDRVATRIANLRTAA